MKTLGRFFVAEVTIQENHKLIKNGFYKYIRHPGYLGIVLLMLGICLTLSSLYALLILIFLGIPLLLYRISYEERMLIKEFGNDYISYIVHTKKIIPFIY